MEKTKGKDELIEEMLVTAEKAGHPSDKPRVVDEADSSTPTVAYKVSSAGYVFIYDTRTGDRSRTNRNMLPTQLKKRRADGSPVFTTKKPSFSPARGTFKCMLHIDDPNREHYNALGLATCRKSNLTNAYQVRRHMQKRHPVEWEVIEEERKAKEKAEDREFQRELMGRAVEKAPLYVSDKDKVK